MSKILIDGRAWSNTGIGTYLQNLAKKLDGIKEFNFEMILQSKDYDRVEFKDIAKHRIDYPLYSYREQVMLAKKIKELEPDLVHFPHFNVPILYNAPFVFTFHDLITLKYPYPKKSIKHVFQRPVMSHAVTKARHIIAISDHTKNDVEQNFPKGKGKIKIIYPGPGQIFPPGGRLPKDIRPPYAMYVGNLFVHKNVEFLVENWKLILEKNPDLKLVLVGSGGEKKRLAELAKTKKLPVIMPGYLSDSELGAVYKHASVFVFPSLAEGFGMPPLEAMQHGVPVVSSNASCMPEVLGDAAFYFEPHNPREMAEKITQVMKDDSLRYEMIRKGFEQVRKYSWDKMARETIEVYRQALT